MRKMFSILALFVCISAEARAETWTGFYVGAQAGYASSAATTTQDVADWGNNPTFIGPFNYDLDGAIGGGSLGYNFQQSNFVFGFEGDFGYLGLSGHRTSASSNPIYHQDHNVDGGLHALLAGRVGITFANTLLYAKGGYLWLDGNQDMTTTKPGYATTPASGFNGVAYGGGIEYALGQGWSVKAEYLRIDLDSEDASQTSVTDPPIGHVYENHTSFDALDTVTVGFNWKFPTSSK